jgi:hypothetical protein
MTKKRFMFASNDGSRNGIEKSNTRGPRLFLAAMIIYGGISGMFQPGPARDGPVAQFAIWLSQEWRSH